MRATRKLFLASALALAAMVVAIPSASAVTITQEPGGACPAGPSVSAHIVTGGCHVSFEDVDGIPLLAHTGAAEVVLSNCAVSLEARLATNGTGFITEQVFSDVSPGSCTRRPCDEVSGPMRKHPWPIAITSSTTLELTMCLRTTAQGEHRPGTMCTKHYVIVLIIVIHRYRIGVGVPTERACEGLPQVETTDVELDSTGEQIEIS